VRRVAVSVVDDAGRAPGLFVAAELIHGSISLRELTGDAADGDRFGTEPRPAELAERIAPEPVTFGDRADVERL
jgi:hypothetical protein